MKYYLGPWQWVTLSEPSFSMPVGAIGAIDLGKLPEMAVAGVERSGCLCWSQNTLPSEYTLLGDGDCRELKPGASVKSAFQSLIGYRPQGTTLVEMIYDCLTGGSDADGASGPVPIVPTSQGWIDLWMPGHSRVFSERFEWGRPGSRGSNHTGKLRQLLRKQFAELMDDAQKGKLKDSQHHRRCLDAMCEKYGLQGAEDWREFVPTALQRDVPGRLKHETSIADNFNRADNTTALGTASGGFSWANQNGTIGILSNQANSQASSSVNESRAESDLSSSDHYSQVNGYSGGGDVGPLVRFANAARTHYGFRNLGSDKRFFKRVAAALTNLATATSTPSSGDVLYVEANGSTITAKINGSTAEGPVTDTSITGNTRAGITASGTNGPIDNFTAADLGTVGLIYTQLERSTRGLNRGMYTRWG